MEGQLNFSGICMYEVYEQYFLSLFLWATVKGDKIAIKKKPSEVLVPKEGTVQTGF